MRRWGFVITSFYTLLLLLLVVPVGAWLAGGLDGVAWSDTYWRLYSQNPGLACWVVLALFILGEALLLFTSVDTTWRRVTPRRHIAVSAATTALFVTLLAIAAISSLWVALPEKVQPGERYFPFSSGLASLAPWVTTLWVFWAVVFYAYYRSAPKRIATAVSWLLRASVLELLIAVPSHVIVRRRDECSAPPVTAFGIGTGIAVMLACFGPGVLALYAKRVGERRHHGRHATRSAPAA